MTGPSFPLETLLVPWPRVLTSSTSRSCKSQVSSGHIRRETRFPSSAERTYSCRFLQTTFVLRRILAGCVPVLRSVSRLSYRFSSQRNLNLLHLPARHRAKIAFLPHHHPHLSYCPPVLFPGSILT